MSARRAPLDWLNFLLADVQGGLGPFPAIYLTAGQHWDPGSAGLMLTIGGIATVVASVPMGALVDRLGFGWAFLVLSGFALAALALFVRAVPETRAVC